ncbi:MAG: prepilin-type N-terminal cleavage/methylation domain-containing protein, partial [Planctomycetota bacterium]
GFTLIELLVVMGILGVLISILLPALNGVRVSAKRVVCATNMRSVTREFRFFVDGTSEFGRGDSERFGSGRFHINDFQDALYHLDEFWDLGRASTGTLTADRNPMLCPAGAPKLIRRKGYPCGRESLGPVRDVSLALNMRLYRAVVDFRGKPMLAPVASTFVPATILQHPLVPLVMDVDGAAADEKGADPYYIAPPQPGSEDPYRDGRFWSPSDRHGGKVNVAFVGGHVLSSEHPARERWNWTYQATAQR